MDNKTETVSEWISVKERLPDKGVWILFYSWRGILLGSFWDNYWHTQEINGPGLKMYLEQVSHWMPLPKPPNHSKT